MRIGSSKEITNIEKSAIEEYGIPSIVLMENAALKLLKNINIDECGHVTIVCGNGNNGGDGLALARLLISFNKDIKIFLINPSKKLSKNCKLNFNILIKMGININLIESKTDLTYLKNSIRSSDILIDGIFGTGLTRDITGVYAKVIESINKYASYILSIDVPSGFNSDTGNIMGIAVEANKTITFQLYKKGFLSYESEKYTGKIILEELNIPKIILEKNHNNVFMSTYNLVKKNIPIRSKYNHKGDFGKILIFAGSRGFTGAAFICTESAVKTGSGLITLACHKDIEDILCEKLTEAMVINYSSINNYKKFLVTSNVIAFGPGMGNTEETLSLLKNILLNYKNSLVIDADGINILKDNLNLLDGISNKVILTPHVAEMSRISGYTIEYINNNRLNVAIEFAKKHNVIILLKGFYTVITDGDTTYVNPTGNSAMASGGMGDCLTGIITSLIGQKLDPLMACVVGAYIHGYIGNSLSENMYCVNATHIIEKIPYILKKMQHN